MSIRILACEPPSLSREQRVRKGDLEELERVAGDTSLRFLFVRSSVTSSERRGERGRGASGTHRLSLLPSGALAEVGVGRDQHCSLRRRVVEHHRVTRGLQPGATYMNGTMPGCGEQLTELLSEVLVENEVHAPRRSGSSRSRTASAAYRRASLTSSGSRSGKSRVISSTVIPSATIATTVATGMRSPRMHGAPPILSNSTVIRSYVTTPC